MPVNWNKFDKALDDAVERGVARTDAQLASEISSLTRLTDAEVKKLFPEPADVEKLGQLLKIVKSAEDRNRKQKRIADNIEDLSGTVLTLLDKFT